MRDEEVESISGTVVQRDKRLKRRSCVSLGDKNMKIARVESAEMS